jgi:hypothetical protein
MQLRARQSTAINVFLIQPKKLEPVNLTNDPANDLEPAWRLMP